MDSLSSSSSNLHSQAIKAALNSSWTEAITINQQIIETDPNNIDALNRLAHAFFETEDYPKAKKYYGQVLENDPYNPIASKNLKILQCFKDDELKTKNGHNGINHFARVSPSLFLQEPGKTKVVNLLKVAEPQKLSQTYCGMQVEFVIKNRGITITDSYGTYLGVLPDDISHTLLKLIKGGNKYATYVKSVKVNGLSILIRETFRSAKFRNQPSFLEFNTSASLEMLAPLERKEIVEEDMPPEESEEES
jgi:tetratricopeptide (TPR) repeat protein